MWIKQVKKWVCDGVLWVLTANLWVLGLLRAGTMIALWVFRPWLRVHALVLWVFNVVLWVLRGVLWVLAFDRWVSGVFLPLRRVIWWVSVFKSHMLPWFSHNKPTKERHLSTFRAPTLVFPTIRHCFPTNEPSLPTINHCKISGTCFVFLLLRSYPPYNPQ